MVVLGVAAAVVVGGLVVAGGAVLDAFGDSGRRRSATASGRGETDGTGHTGRRARRAADGPREPHVVGCDDDAAVHVILDERPADADPSSCLGWPAPPPR